MLAGCLLAAGDALPGLGITSQMSSFPAQLTWASPEVSWRPPLCPVCPGSYGGGGGLLAFPPEKDALFYEADDSLGNLCHY